MRLAALVAAVAAAVPTAATPITSLEAAPLIDSLLALAAGEARGMETEGQVVAASFRQGQTLEHPLSLRAGRCYTIVVASDAIEQLELQLVTGGGLLPPMVIAEAKGAKAAVMGGKAGCWQNPTPLGGPARLVVKAARGAGKAAAQVFVK